MLGSKGPAIGNGLRGIKWSRERLRHVTLKGQTPYPNTLKVQYLGKLATDGDRDSVPKDYQQGYQMVTFLMTSHDPKCAMRQYGRLS